MTCHLKWHDLYTSSLVICSSVVEQDSVDVSEADAMARRSVFQMKRTLGGEHYLEI